MRRKLPRYHSCSSRGDALTGRVQPSALTRQNGQPYCRRAGGFTLPARKGYLKSSCHALAPTAHSLPHSALRLLRQNRSYGIVSHFFGFVKTKTEIFRSQLIFATSGRSYALPFSFVPLKSQLRKTTAPSMLVPTAPTRISSTPLPAASPIRIVQFSIVAP